MNLILFKHYKVVARELDKKFRDLRPSVNSWGADSQLVAGLPPIGVLFHPLGGETSWQVVWIDRHNMWRWRIIQDNGEMEPTILNDVGGGPYMDESPVRWSLLGTSRFYRDLLIRKKAPDPELVNTMIERIDKLLFRK